MPPMSTTSYRLLTISRVAQKFHNVLPSNDNLDISLFHGWAHDETSSKDFHLFTLEPVIKFGEHKMLFNKCFMFQRNFKM